MKECFNWYCHRGLQVFLSCIPLVLKALKGSWCTSQEVAQKAALVHHLLPVDPWDSGYEEDHRPLHGHLYPHLMRLIQCTNTSFAILYLNHFYTFAVCCCCSVSLEFTGWLLKLAEERNISHCLCCTMLNETALASYVKQLKVSNPKAIKSWAHYSLLCINVLSIQLYCVRDHTL